MAHKWSQFFEAITWIPWIELTCQACSRFFYLERHLHHPARVLCRIKKCLKMMSMHVCWGHDMCTQALVPGKGGQKRVSETLELDFQAIMSLIQVLGTKLGSFARAVLLSHLSSPQNFNFDPWVKTLKKSLLLMLLFFFELCCCCPPFLF